jgi:hypothetical protein
MSTVNFSVPDDVKHAFNATFEGRNKSAIIAALMREAVERDQQAQRGAAAVARILRRRRNAPVASDETIRKARTLGRP